MSGDKKIIHDLPLDALLELAQGAPQEAVIEKLSEAAKFIFAVGIKHGTTKVPAQTVYYCYRDWKGWRNKPQPKLYFFRDFKKYFKSERDKDGVYYLLNDKPFDMSEENYWLIRKEIREERARQKKKKKST